MTENSIGTPGPTFALSDADSIQDGIVTIREAYRWVKKFNSRQIIQNDDPQWSDMGNIGKATSLEYPTLINDEINNIDTVRGLAAIPVNVAITAGHNLVICGNTKIDFLNQAALLVQKGALLTISGDVEFYENTAGTISIEGVANITGNVKIPVPVTVKSNAVLRISNEGLLTMTQNADIILEPGSKLILSGGIINLAENSEIMVQKSDSLQAVIEINGNSAVQLSGSNSFIDITGNISLNANAWLMITGNGFTKFNGTATYGSNTKLTFEGNGINQTMLKIVCDVFPVKAAEFTLRNGKVYFETTGGQIKLDQAGTAITAENVLFTAPAGQKFNYGLNLTSPTQANITNCIFEHGKTGINIINTDMVPHINTCTKAI